jgi:hypothetical protein
MRVSFTYIPITAPAEGPHGHCVTSPGVDNSSFLCIKYENLAQVCFKTSGIKWRMLKLTCPVSLLVAILLSSTGLWSTKRPNFERPVGRSTKRVPNNCKSESIISSDDGSAECTVTDPEPPVEAYVFPSEANETAHADSLQRDDHVKLLRATTHQAPHSLHLFRRPFPFLRSPSCPIYHR